MAKGTFRGERSKTVENIVGAVIALHQRSLSDEVTSNPNGLDLAVAAVVKPHCQKSCPFLYFQEQERKEKGAVVARYRHHHEGGDGHRQTTTAPFSLFSLALQREGRGHDFRGSISLMVTINVRSMSLATRLPLRGYGCPCWVFTTLFFILLSSLVDLVTLKQNEGQ
ncbi:hypothetical protein CRG98_015134 [Punica granatum]|uniref:Uncharacterized protein n=1 Tax=Punica granatum TaxID=22663 RepID=A0A2I0K8E2_PUNGR|nr:hypothetical protein CRG98_015134 [Punica granatum]